MTGWDTRAQIGLRAPRGINTNINPTHGVVFHYAGGGTHRRSAHSGCRALWRAYQDWHLHPTNANNYSDIAYNLGVCVHDIILEGRSTRSRPRVRGGANGNATVNGNRYSICAIWGANDGTPPDSLKRAYLAARAFLRSNGGAGSGIVGHRDLSSTGCPGQPIYNWVRAGAPAPGGANPPPPPKPPQEDVMTPVQMAELKSYIDARTDPRRVLEVSLKPDTNEPKMSEWAWDRIPPNWNPRVAKIIGYTLGDTRQILAELSALRGVVAELLEHDPSNPLTRADLDAAIEQGMRKVRVEVAVVDDEDS